MSQLTLPDPRKNARGLARRDGPATMKMAANNAYPRTGTGRWKVLNAIAVTGGMTDEEIQQVTHINANSERPRRVELVRGGWVKASTRNRTTFSGEEAIVWELTDKAEKEYFEETDDMAGHTNPNIYYSGHLPSPRRSRADLRASRQVVAREWLAAERGGADDGGGGDGRRVGS